MQLREFVTRFEGLSDEAFLANFGHPFLLETGPVLESGTSQAKRLVFLLRPRGGHGLTVGRTASCDVQLPVENISSRHAVLLPPQAEGQAWSILDTRSTNGTYLEGTRLEPGATLEMCDAAALRFGPDYRFTFLKAESFLSRLRLLAKNLPRGSGERAYLGQTDPSLQAQLSDSGVGEAPQAGVEEILLHADAEGSDSLPLRVGDTVVIGRTPKNAGFVLPHKNVSRAHAEIQRREEGVFIRDLGSSNGTFIGATRVGPRWLELLINKNVAIGPYTLNVSGPQEALSRTSVVETPRPTPREGSLEKTPVRDILSEVEMSQLTGVLRLEAGALRGVISFRAGEPYDARTRDGLDGLEALQALFGLQHGRYWLDLDSPLEGRERKILRTFAEVALDAFFDGT